jgi:hypothetical protein
MLRSTTATRPAGPYERLGQPSSGDILVHAHPAIGDGPSASRLLYTRGSVEFFSTYPGMYVPQPLAMRIDAGDTTAKELARETLALTKMNWNNTQFDGHAPITIRAARQVGSILKYVGPDDPLESRYANYM